MNSMTASHPMSKTSTGRIALFVILGSESVFFITLLVAYAALRDQVNWNIAHTLARLSLPLINTAILLVSAVVAWQSNNAIRRNEQAALRNGLLLTVGLGLLFVAGQIYEFSHAGLHINDQAFGGVFFTLMGFHALHVLGGIVFLLLNWIRANLGDFTAGQYETVELGSWFWYYVTLVWIVLFIALYLI